MSNTLTLDDTTFATLEAEAKRVGDTVEHYAAVTWQRFSKAQEIGRSALPAPLQRYQHYLFQEVAQGATPPDAAKRMLAFLRDIFLEMPDAPKPGMGTAERQVLCTWDKGEHHLEIEVFAGGDGEWFYMNRDTRAVWEEDWQLGTPLSSDAKQYLEQVRP